MGPSTIIYLLLLRALFVFHRPWIVHHFRRDAYEVQLGVLNYHFDGAAARVWCIAGCLQAKVATAAKDDNARYRRVVP